MKTLSLSDLKSNLFSGEDSFGRHYELAIKENKFFHRSCIFNGYGMGWSKWELLNKFNGEFYLSECENYGNREMLKWGFGMDASGSINKRIKLPN